MTTLLDIQVVHQSCSKDNHFNFQCIGFVSEFLSGRQALGGLRAACHSVEMAPDFSLGLATCLSWLSMFFILFQG